MTFDGRLEALVTVPAGVSVSATNAGGTATVFLPQNTYFVSTLLSTLQSQLNSTSPLSATWTVSLSTGPAGTGQVTINGGGTWSLSWTAAGMTLQTLLGFDVTGNISNSVAAVTGSKQCRGVWIPDCPIRLDGDPQRAPIVTDLRTTMSPTGKVLGLVGNVFYRHTKVTWSHVDISRTWEAKTTIANSSFELFMKDTQLGQGLSWFTPATPLQIYDLTGTKLGIDLNGGTGPTNGWQIADVSSVEPPKADPAWTGRWTIELPQIVSQG